MQKLKQNLLMDEILSKPSQHINFINTRNQFILADITNTQIPKEQKNIWVLPTKLNKAEETKLKRKLNNFDITLKEIGY